MKNLVLFGIQGSGKGTVSEFLIKEFNFSKFETGAEVRKLAKSQSELGKMVKEIINAGKLLPNKVVMDIIENYMQNLEPNSIVLFDGIPRSKIQSETFNSLMKTLGREFICMELKLNDEIALKRLTERRVCDICGKSFAYDYKGNIHKEDGGNLVTRQDDNIEAIKQRLILFHEKTQPVIEEYKASHMFISIDADDTIKNVKKDAINQLNKI
jgi:adenylate kinase